MTRFERVNRFVKTKNVHIDKRSKEIATGKVKHKYKLAGKPIQDLDQFIFFILAGSHPEAHHKQLQIKVDAQEWLNRSPAHSNRLLGVSSIDITRHEVLTSTQVARKIIDVKNGFAYIAELPEEKFQQLQDKLVKLHSLPKLASPETERLLAKTLDITAWDIIKKLGI